MTRQNILITGASSGLGAEMARQFAACGRHLALCARRGERLEALQRELQDRHPGGRFIVRTLDVDQHEQVFAVFDELQREMGGLDRVIVNAGIGKGAAIGTGHFHANRQTAMTNFVSALAQCEAAMGIFRRQDRGHLVVISSVSAVRGFRGALTTYAASKAALSSLAEGIRIDMLATPIAVTTIHPGFIRTALNEKVRHAPFIVDAEPGCRAIVKAIERERASAFVPFWPWAVLHPMLRIAPLALLRRLT